VKKLIFITMLLVSYQVQADTTYTLTRTIAITSSGVLDTARGDFKGTGTMTISGAVVVRDSTFCVQRACFDTKQRDRITAANNNSVWLESSQGSVITEHKILSLNPVILMRMIDGIGNVSTWTLNK